MDTIPRSATFHKFNIDPCSQEVAAEIAGDCGCIFIEVNTFNRDGIPDDRCTGLIGDPDAIQEAIAITAHTISNFTEKDASVGMARDRAFLQALQHVPEAKTKELMQSGPFYKAVELARDNILRRD